jgi:hypothetical protein
MENQIHSKRFAVFFAIFLVTAWPLLFSMVFIAAVLAGWIEKGLRLDNLEWPILFPVIAWFFWIRFSVKWIYNRYVHPGALLVGFVFGIISVVLFSHGALTVLPAIIFACYLCYWNLIPSDSEPTDR